MADTGNAPAVSIHPGSFTSELPDLSTLALEEVVARFKDVEKKRNPQTEPDSEAEVFWAIRRAPVELVSSLRVVAAHLGVSRAVLTKCISRQVADWYTNSLGLTELETAYNDIYSKIKLKGYTTLRIQAENPAKFSFAQQPEDVYVSVSTIRWVLTKLGDVKEIVGVSGTDLLLAGFCWSLTTLENREWDKHNIDNMFELEAGNVSLIIKDRLVDVRALCAKYTFREGVL
jgi:hypothetical protein